MCKERSTNMPHGPHGPHKRVLTRYSLEELIKDLRFPITEEQYRTTEEVIAGGTELQNAINLLEAKCASRRLGVFARLDPVLDVAKRLDELDMLAPIDFYETLRPNIVGFDPTLTRDAYEAFKGIMKALVDLVNVLPKFKELEGNPLMDLELVLANKKWKDENDNLCYETVDAKYTDKEKLDKVYEQFNPVNDEKVKGACKTAYRALNKVELINLRMRIAHLKAD